MGEEEEGAPTQKEEEEEHLHHSCCRWYHGPITRIAAELGVVSEGDFLLRDCISSPGDLVLTCRWGGQVLHFRLNRVAVTGGGTNADKSTAGGGGGEPRLLYQFEDECFDSVSALVAFHLSGAVPISALSGAIIRQPVARDSFSAVLDGAAARDGQATEETATDREERMGQHQYGSLGEPPAESFSSPSGNDSADKREEEEEKQAAPGRSAVIQNTYFFGDSRHDRQDHQQQAASALPHAKDKRPAFSSFKPVGGGISGPPDQSMIPPSLGSRQCQSMILDGLTAGEVMAAAAAGEGGGGGGGGGGGQERRREESMQKNQCNSLPRIRSGISKQQPFVGNRMGQTAEVVRVSWQSDLCSSFSRPPPLVPAPPASSSSSMPTSRETSLPPRPKARPLPPPPVAASAQVAAPEVERRKKKRCVPPPPLPERKSSSSANKGKGKNGKPSDPFPEDIKLPRTTVPPPPVEKEPPPPIQNRSTAAAPSSSSFSFSSAYDVPSSTGRTPRSCLTERQEEGSALYDEPRTLSKFRPFRGVPPPPPSRSGSTVSSSSNDNGVKKKEDGRGNSGSNNPRPCTVVRLSYTAKQTASSGVTSLSGTALCCGEPDCTSVLSEVSNTDTSYLEHRELTPLLSSDNDSMVFDTNSLPGDPFPAGLPIQNANSAAAVNANNTGNAGEENNPARRKEISAEGQNQDGGSGCQSTTGSSSSSSYSQTSSLLDSSPPMESAAKSMNMTPMLAQGEEGGEEEGEKGLTYFSAAGNKEREGGGTLRRKKKPSPKDADLQGTGGEKEDLPINLGKERDCQKEDKEKKQDVSSNLEGGGRDPSPPAQSMFDLERYCRSGDSFFFSGSSESKPLDPSAMATALAVLMESPSRSLAMHLLALDVELLSIDLVVGRYPGLPEVRSGLHLLTLVEGHALRQDVMERFLCLRLFVLVTVLGASSFRCSVSALARWVGVASGCVDLGNQMGMAAVASALRNPRLRSLKGLWSALARDYPKEQEDLTEKLDPLLERLNKLTASTADKEDRELIKSEEERDVDCFSSSSPVTVPHTIPFLAGCRDLKDRKTFMAIFEEIYGDGGGDAGGGGGDAGDCSSNPDVLPLFQCHLRRTHSLLQSCASLQDSSARALADFRPDPRLAELLSCEFHLRLLWGSRGAREDASDARHAKFGKVVRVLALLCGSIEASVLGVKGGGDDDEEEEEEEEEEKEDEKKEEKEEVDLK